MTTPKLRTDRVRTSRYIKAMVALDTIDGLAARVTNLVKSGRRMAVTHRYTYTGHAPEVTAGLTLDEDPEFRHRKNDAWLTVRLKPGALQGFGFAAYVDEAATEEQVWRQYHAAAADRDRRNMTMVEMNGGLTGDGPARDDSLIIRHWNDHGVCREQVVAFDYHTGPEQLRTVRDALRRHVDTLADQQPWDNRNMFEQVLAALDAEVGPAAAA